MLQDTMAQLFVYFKAIAQTNFCALTYSVKHVFIFILFFTFSLVQVTCLPLHPCQTNQSTWAYHASNSNNNNSYNINSSSSNNKSPLVAPPITIIYFTDPILSPQECCSQMSSVKGRTQVVKFILVPTSVAGLAKFCQFGQILKLFVHF